MLSMTCDNAIILIAGLNNGFVIYKNYVLALDVLGSVFLSLLSM
jgi:hypothetical protein